MGRLGGCASCLKYIMFAFNFLIWLVGCALIAIGIWVLVDDNISTRITDLFKDETDEDTKKEIDYIIGVLQAGAIIVIVVGSVVMITGFLACFGAIRESQCLLSTYAIILFVIFAVLVASAIYFAVSQDDFFDKATEVLNKLFNAYKDDLLNGESTKNNLLAFVQKQTWIACCGVSAETNGFHDYYKWTNNKTDSWLKDANFATVAKAVHCDQAKADERPDAPGCTVALTNFVKEHIVIVAGAAGGVGAFLILVIVATVCLCCAIRDSDDY